ncbi:hypothetical protein PCANC_05934, partial [Puccinia coronata f. sp. avenae]
MAIGGVIRDSAWRMYQLSPPNTNPEPNQPFIHLDPFIMINYLTNLPNRIPEKQRMFQGDHRLVHQKLPRARLYMGIYYTIFGASMLWSANGLYKLIR